MLPTAFLRYYIKLCDTSILYIINDIYMRKFGVYYYCDLYL